jgi:hypothetical protein
MAGGNGTAFSLGAWREPQERKVEDTGPFSPAILGSSVDWQVHSAQSDSSGPSIRAAELSILNDLENQMARFSAVEIEDLKKLRQEYVLVDGSSIETFIRSHRSLLEVLLDAVVQMRSCFGRDCILHLRMGSEDGDAPNVVCGFVRWTKDLESARAALDAFDESWWINNVRRGSGRVVFDYELA